MKICGQHVRGSELVKAEKITAGTVRTEGSSVPSRNLKKEQKRGVYSESDN